MAQWRKIHHIMTQQNYIYWILGTLLLTKNVISEASSIVVKRGGRSSDFILLDAPETLHHGSVISLEYRSSRPDMMIGVELEISTDKQNNVIVFRKIWPLGTANKVHNEKITISLPYQLRFRPSHNNHVSTRTTQSKVRAWLLKKEVFESSAEPYTESRIRTFRNIRIASPWERQEKTDTRCHSFINNMLISQPYNPQCPYEKEMFSLIDFPVALTGTFHGVNRVLPEYKNEVLKRTRQEEKYTSKFTISMWLYIQAYCPQKWHTCSILQRLTWDGIHLTPLIYITPRGNVFVQLYNDQHKPLAYATEWVVPTEQWVHLVSSYENQQWHVNLEYGEGFNKTLSATFYIQASHVIWNDDVLGSYIIGGSHKQPSFKGFVGKATIYRRQFKTPKQIPHPDPNHPMFQIHLTERHEQCELFTSIIRHTVYTSQLLLQSITQKKTCANHLRTFILSAEPILPTSWSTTCSLFGGIISPQHREVVKWVKRQIMSGKNMDLSTLGKQLYDKVTSAMEYAGLDALKSQVDSLTQASCYGHHDASFMLSAILNAGLGVKVNQLQSHSYLLTTAIEGHRMSMLAMANKHTHGIDGLATDYEQAYPYYKYVADWTRADKEAHRETDVFTEMIRLTNEHQMKAQTDETGHLFQWYKHQAQQNVLSAQKTLAQMLFWGSGGVKRDLKQAASFYKEGAKKKDPQALFDYGIVLLRGQGVQKDVPKALQLLLESADLKHVPAYNALGWYFLEKMHDYGKAVEWFEKADYRNNPDAAYNLGHMYLNGRVPNKQVDRNKAFQYFRAGAHRGQHDSAIMFSQDVMYGHPLHVRDPVTAVEWARYVAEQNPANGWALHKGLKAYRKEAWAESILYYMMAASSGLEVANFNIAYLCEENKNYITSYMEKECVYRHYNLTTKRQFQFVDPYAWIKMGDYHWYGCGGQRDAREAAYQYAMAAYKHDPHAVFNLGFLVEQGSYVPEFIWNNLKIPREAQNNNLTLLTEIYKKCKESYKTEAYIPCTLAFWNIQVQIYWQTYHILVKVLGVLVAGLLGLLLGPSMLAIFRRAEIRLDV